MNSLTGTLRAVAAAFAATAALAAPAYAEYPEHPIRAIVPFAPGGANDVMGRLLGPQLAKLLGQPVVIENRAGASGNVGIDVVAKSAPDGYTLVFSATASTQNPALFRNMPFDPVKDVRPVAKIGEGAYVVMINPKLPVDNLTSLVDYAKKNPGKLNGASGGVGTQLSIELFKFQNDLQIEVIPYSGTGPASLAVLRGEADLGIMDTSAVVENLITGAIKPLAVAGEKRLPSLPNVPTTTEAGLPKYKAGTIFGLYAQGRTPDDITLKLNRAMNQALAMPDVIEALRKLGVETDPKTPEAFAKQIHEEIALWKDIVARAKIPPLD